MLTGKAKTDYQRGYMKDYMSRYRAKNKDSALSSQEQGLENAPGLIVMPEPVKTHKSDPVSLRPIKTQPVKTQSHSPMMVGYVPSGSNER